jgi:hypothetical protein
MPRMAPVIHQNTNDYPLELVHIWAVQIRVSAYAVCCSSIKGCTSSEALGNSCLESLKNSRASIKQENVAAFINLTLGENSANSIHGANANFRWDFFSHF